MIVVCGFYFPYKSLLVLYSIEEQIAELKASSVPFLVIGNKADIGNSELVEWLNGQDQSVLISAKKKDNLEALRNRLKDFIATPSQSDVIVTNARHLQSLQQR